MQQETPQKKTSVVEGNGAEIDCDATSKVPPFIDSVKVEDQNIKRNWEERYIALQNSLKKCEEKSYDDLQKLEQLPPAELAMCVAELERRAIQLQKEEEMEWQRMKELKILEENFADVIDPSLMTRITEGLIPKKEN